VVIAMVNDAQNKGIIVRLSCETDFVAKNEDFVQLTKDIAKLALDNFPGDREALYQLKLNGVTLETVMSEQVAKIGEKIEISDYQTLEAPLVTSYIHMGYKAGVLVGLNKSDEKFVEAGRDVAMQVAAMKPVALNKDDVAPEIIAKEIEIGKEIARQEGKAEDMLEKIAMGKLNKFFKEMTLLNQVFVKDGKISIEEYLRSKNPDLTATAFRHVKLG
jgi:elongation factor Ts